MRCQINEGFCKKISVIDTIYVIDEFKSSSINILYMFVLDESKSFANDIGLDLFREKRNQRSS